MTADIDTPAIGIDVSSYQGHVDWDAVAGSGMAFMWARASEGMTVDPLYVDHFCGAQKAGLLAGLYLFFRARHTGAEQATQILQLLNNAEQASGTKAALPIALDLETFDGKSDAVFGYQVHRFIDKVADAGERLIIYTGPGFFDPIPLSSVVGIEKVPLWLADYRATPRCPHAWDRWTFLQMTGIGMVPGVRGPCDKNRFAGTSEELLAWLIHPAFGIGNKPATPRNDT